MSTEIQFFPDAFIDIEPPWLDDLALWSDYLKQVSSYSDYEFFREEAEHATKMVSYLVNTAVIERPQRSAPISNEIKTKLRSLTPLLAIRAVEAS